MKKSWPLLLLVVAPIVGSVYIGVFYETPAQRMDNALKGIQINVDEGSVAKLQQGIAAGQRMFQDTYEKYKDDPEKLKEETDKQLQELIDAIGGP